MNLSGVVYLFISVWIRKHACACIQWYTYVSIRRCCAIRMSWIRFSLSNGIHILRVFRVRCEYLMESKSWSWMHRFLFNFFYVWLALQTWMPLYTHTPHTQISHIMHALTMEMEIHSFWRVFRTPVIVFDFRTNYGNSVLVGSSDIHMYLDW